MISWATSSVESHYRKEDRLCVAIMDSESEVI
jgi:hypothetical protein